MQAAWRSCIQQKGRCDTQPGDRAITQQARLHHLVRCVAYCCTRYKELGTDIKKTAPMVKITDGDGTQEGHVEFLGEANETWRKGNIRGGEWNKAECT